MPKEPIKYENTIIYKIICLVPDINNIYVGYTTDIIRRKYYHKIKSLDPKNNKYKLYHFINQHGGFNNFDIIEIKKYPCMNNNQAREKQYKYIKLLNADLNSNNVINKSDNVKGKVLEVLNISDCEINEKAADFISKGLRGNMSL